MQEVEKSEVHLEQFPSIGPGFQEALYCKEGKLATMYIYEQRYFDLKILPTNDDHSTRPLSRCVFFGKGRNEQALIPSK